jgi:deoxyribodipyrimidine photo-lyase
VTRAVVLFTRDLRVHDHPALNEAVEIASEIVPLFVLDDALRHDHDSSVRRAFLRNSLSDVRHALRERGGDLVIRRGDTVEETLRLTQQAAATVVFIGADAGAYAQRRQERLARACRRERIEFHVENTIAAVPPGELAPAGRDHYRIFTPYWQRWRDQPLPTPLERPRRVALPPGIDPGDLTSAAPGLRGGERAARRRLDEWLRDGLPDYETARNQLGRQGTSRLSPYLHLGCLSAAEVVTRARAQGAIAEPFVRQLAWRDFYLQLLTANPHTATDDLHGRGREWIEDEDALTAWAEGRTGYPIVDAAMRQLRAEGWIHNRSRLLVASFLTKTLGIGRRGAKLFLELLLDGDVANNAGNWQWVAGTGVDSRPNRAFNPIAQAKRLDPEGEYVRTYVPELKELEGSTVHEPWRAPLVTRAPEYPHRIVALEHAAVRARRLATG